MERVPGFFSRLISVSGQPRQAGGFLSAIQGWSAMFRHYDPAGVQAHLATVAIGRDVTAAPERDAPRRSGASGSKARCHRQAALYAARVGSVAHLGHVPGRSGCRGRDVMPGSRAPCLRSRPPASHWRLEIPEKTPPCRIGSGKLSSRCT